MYHYWYIFFFNLKGELLLWLWLQLHRTRCIFSSIELLHNRCPFIFIICTKDVIIHGQVIARQVKWYGTMEGSAVMCRTYTLLYITVYIFITQQIETPKFLLRKNKNNSYDRTVIFLRHRNSNYDRHLNGKIYLISDTIQRLVQNAQNVRRNTD